MIIRHRQSPSYLVPSLLATRDPVGYMWARRNERGNWDVYLNRQLLVPNCALHYAVEQLERGPLL